MVALVTGSEVFFFIEVWSFFFFYFIDIDLFTMLGSIQPMIIELKIFVYLDGARLPTAPML
jgi:hypothetical protein